jgi:hypothetical protein
MAEAKDGKRREGMVVIAVRSLLSDGEIARGGVGAFRGERGIMGWTGPFFFLCASPHHLLPFELKQQCTAGRDRKIKLVRDTP